MKSLIQNGMRAAKTFGVIASLALAMSGNAQALIVTNGGFETGNFSGWTQFGNAGFTGVSGFYSHTGSSGAYFGSVGSTGGIYQTLSTTAGSTYNVSFWLRNTGGTFNSADFNWNFGTSEFSVVNVPATAYTLYSFLLTATAATTDLRFTFRQDPSYWGLDDVSAVAVPEPAPLALLSIGLALGLAGFGLARRRARA
jgi:hypothetical protein